MYVRACRLREALEKILGQLGLEIADSSRRKSRLDHAKWTSTEIDSGRCQRFVHGHQEISGSQNAFFISEGSCHRLTKRNTNVLHGVVLIHIEIALRGDLQIETAVTRDQVQHVIEETDARVNFGLAAAIEI